MDRRETDAQSRESERQPGQVMSRLTLSCEERPCEPSRRAQVARQYPGWLWSALAGLMVLTGLAAPAAAQTVQTLVSNSGETRPRSGSASISAQSIRTGGHDSGYTVSQIALHLFTVASRRTTVKLYSNSDSGEPQDLVATLVNPDTFRQTQFNTFTAPSGTMLSRNTTYWIVVNEDIGDSTQRVAYSNTGSDADTSSYGWSIGNERLIKSAQTDPWRTNTFVLSMTVKGSFTNDTTEPRVTSIARQSPASSPTNADNLTWRVIFSEDVANVDAADFALTGTTAALTVGAVTGSTAAYDVTASGGDLASLDGTVTLSFASDQNIADTASNPNTLTNTTPTGTNEDNYVVNNTAAPTLSIEVYPLSVPENDPDDDKAEVIITPSADFPTDQTITLAVSGTATEGTDYTIDDKTLTLVVGDQDAFTGIIILPDTITEGDETVIITGSVAGNSFGTATLTIEDVVPADATAPGVTSIERLTPSSSPTNSDTLIWQVTFSEDVTGVDAADFALAGATAATLSVSTVTASTVFSVTASDGDLATLDATVTLSFASGQNIADTAGNALTAANTTPTGTNDDNYVVDNTAPTVTISSVPLTSTGPFTARFTFSQAVTGFTLGDITLTNATASSFMTLSSSIYTARIAPTTDGALTVDVAASVAMDAAGNNNTAAVRASSTYDPSATVGGICGRTEQVRVAILAKIDDISVCDDVTNTHLANITGTLSLGSASITTLAAGDFDGLRELHWLNLFGNQLTVLPSGIFGDLTKLTILGLNRNALTALPDGVFNNLTNLILMRLQHNELNELPDRVFEPLRSLQRLQLHGNPGADFSPTAVAQPDNGTVPDTGGMVTLDSSGSGGAWGSNVTYSWALTSPATGVDVTFDDNSISTPTVTIPPLAAGITELTFTLTVTAVGALSGITTGVDTATVRVMDETAPRVASITRQSPTSSPTNADDPTWLVTFNEDVANLDAADFMLSGTTATLTVSTVTASAYNVMASGGNLDALDGTVTLTFAAGQDIADIAGHALANTTPTGTNDNTYLVDNTAPTVTISGVPANSGVPFTAAFTFSQGVTGFAATDITLGNGVASSFMGSAGDTAYTAVISPSATGTVTLDVAAGVAMDLAGNDNTAAARAISTYDSSYDPSLGICGRTGAVRTGILGLISGVSSCADVTTEHLAAIASTNFLNLNSKGITTIAAGDFAGLTSLGYLWLSSNQLTSLPDGIFDELTGLTSLTISNNSLSALPDGIFDNLTALKTLWLDRNNLSTLPGGIFDNLTALTSLQLHSNQLATLPDGVFESLTSLAAVGLRLQGNPGAPFSPTAVAMPDSGTVAAGGGDVMLDGSGSSGGAWGSNVTYSWALTSPTTGVEVTFDDDTSATPTVTIPPLAANTELTFTLTVTGRGGTRGITTGTDTAKVGVANNSAPTAAAGSVTTSEDTAHTFTADDFGFMDADSGDALESVKIESLPAAGKGELQLDNVALSSASQMVTKAQLDDGDLKYVPPANANGDAYASFTFKVNDGTADSASPYTMTVNVTAVNDAPVFSDATLTRSVAENSAANVNVGTVIPEATDADVGATLEYSMEGADAASFNFNVSTRQITTKSGVHYDFEAKRSHSVTIKVSDGTDSDTVAVTINVTDQADTGDSSLNPSAGGSAVTRKSRATYSIRIEGSWNTGVTPGGVPSNSPHFTTFVGGIHNDLVTFLESGGRASAGVEAMAETGSTSRLVGEVNAEKPDAVRALTLAAPGIRGSRTHNGIAFTSDHPRITLTSMIAPTPDWFVGVSGRSLLDSSGNWLSSLTVNLYPWDAGTEDGSEFSLSNANTSPKGVITSIRGRGKFTGEHIARLVFTRTGSVEQAPAAPTGYYGNPFRCRGDPGMGCTDGDGHYRS